MVGVGSLGVTSPIGVVNAAGVRVGTGLTVGTPMVVVVGVLATVGVGVLKLVPSVAGGVGAPKVGTGNNKGASFGNSMICIFGASLLM